MESPGHCNSRIRHLQAYDRNDSELSLIHICRRLNGSRWLCINCMCGDFPWRIHPVREKNGGHSERLQIKSLNGIKVFPYFTIGYMHHLVMIVSFAILCHVICFADSSVMYRRRILGMNRRWRRIVAGMSRCLFCPSPESTSMNLDDLHLGQYFSSTYSFLNRTQPFGQACIGSYVILSA